MFQYWNRFRGPIGAEATMTTGQSRRALAIRQIRAHNRTTTERRLGRENASCAPLDLQRSIQCTLDDPHQRHSNTARRKRRSTWALGPGSDQWKGRLLMSKRQNEANNAFRPSDRPLSEYEEEQKAQRKNLERLRVERLAREKTKSNET